MPGRVRIVWMRLCVSVGVRRSVCVLLNQQYLVFVQIVADYLPLTNASVCVLLAKPLGPFVHESSQLVSLQESQPHCWLWTALLIRKITAQLSPLVLIFLAEQNDLLFFMRAGIDLPKRCGKVMPNNNVI